MANPENDIFPNDIDPEYILPLDGVNEVDPRVTLISRIVHNRIGEGVSFDVDEAGLESPDWRNRMSVTLTSGKRAGRVVCIRAVGIDPDTGATIHSVYKSPDSPV